MAGLRDSVIQGMVSAINREPGKPWNDETGIEFAKDLLAAFAKLYPDEDPETMDACDIWREVEALQAVYVEDGTAHLSLPHRDWLPDRRGITSWYYWQRYREYLLAQSQLPTQVVDNMDELTDEILGELGDPEDTAPWDRRGMIVGEVQAGKTGNYTALINKALDVGYRLIIVLAGTQDDLRSQTQLRVDEGVLGIDTRPAALAGKSGTRIGVGCVPMSLKPRCPVEPMTEASMHGDFSGLKFINHELRPDRALLMVVKKNVRILQRIHKWARGFARVTNGHDRAVNGIPLLLIDDEADYASVNTHDVKADEEPSRINECIRQLLRDFGQKSFVGYTATPFANIFIDPGHGDTRLGDLGDDLFPRDFIFNLPSPSNYIGPAKLFGLPDEFHETRGAEPSPPLPVIEYVNDADTVFPPKHHKDLRVESLPGSLKDAIEAFVLVCAARRTRGQTHCHNSMLVHVTRYNEVQEEVTALVRDHVHRLKQAIEYQTGPDYEKLMERMEERWHADFEQKRETVATLTGDTTLEAISWTQVRNELKAAMSKIQVKTVNGKVKDVLDYKDNADKGISVVAIGGDKLSRGLTLEGISISYFLRPTSLSDTLLQMGRWFGYKDGFADLCRIWTTRKTVELYQWVAASIQELREDFDVMVESGGTPADYGLRVRKSPVAMQITSPNKMQLGQTITASEPVSGRLLETFCFTKDAELQKRNFEEVCEWLNQQPPGEVDPHDSTNTITWRGISGEKIVALLERFDVHPRCSRLSSDSLGPCIENCMRDGDLREWTVCVISVPVPSLPTTKSSPFDGPLSFSIGPQYPLQWTPRRSDAGYVPHAFFLGNQRMISPRDEFRDLTPDEYDRAMQLTREHSASPKAPEPQFPAGPYIREARDRHRGLLLIYPLWPRENPKATEWTDGILPSTPIPGLAFSLPRISSDLSTVQYVVNRIYSFQELDGGDFSDDYNG